MGLFDYILAENPFGIIMMVSAVGLITSGVISVRREICRRTDRRKKIKILECSALELLERAKQLDEEIDRQTKAYEHFTLTLSTYEAEAKHLIQISNGATLGIIFDTSMFWVLTNQLVESANTYNYAVSRTRKLNNKLTEELESCFPKKCAKKDCLISVTKKISDSCNRAEAAVEQNYVFSERIRETLRSVNDVIIRQDNFDLGTDVY